MGLRFPAHIQPAAAAPGLHNSNIPLSRGEFRKKPRCIPYHLKCRVTINKTATGIYGRLGRSETRIRPTPWSRIFFSTCTSVAMSYLLDPSFRHKICSLTHFVSRNPKCPV